tara:strand:- start:63368 stop:64411 length:1044 start_codon:yes stop_codon:yes gene_type:complete
MSDCCGKPKKRMDYIFIGSLLSVSVFYVVHLFSLGFSLDVPFVGNLSADVFEIMNSMWWGLALGVLFVGVVGRIPRELIAAALGKGGTMSGLVRATSAGVLLDLCSHGILMVGAKLYARGASLGQVMAFLIASPWNSLSLTFILWALIGLKWMLLFLLLSMVIAFVSGYIFDKCVANGVLEANPNTIDLPEGYAFKAEVFKAFKGRDKSISAFAGMIFSGIKDAKVVVKWLLFGVVIAALVRNFMAEDMFAMYFGATAFGLMMTTLAATVIEVCSEGSVPIAADIFNKADAPGNSFSFLMAGVSTDYTEIMVLKETLGKWKSALFLPLITLPQILLLAFVLNQMSMW